jgi:hypothetical protein
VKRQEGEDVERQDPPAPAPASDAGGSTGSATGGAAGAGASTVAPGNDTAGASSIGLGAAMLLSAAVFII